MKVATHPPVDAKQYKEPVTFNERIKTAMSTLGWEPKPSVLMDKWNSKFPKKHHLSRQTPYDWFKSKQPKISPQNLFLLADLLEVNARWFVLLGNTPADTMTKPIFADPDMARLTDAYQALVPGFREDLIKEANRLLARQDEASKAHPFKPTKQ